MLLGFWGPNISLLVPCTLLQLYFSLTNAPLGEALALVQFCLVELKIKADNHQLSQRLNSFSLSCLHEVNNFWCQESTPSLWVWLIPGIDSEHLPCEPKAPWLVTTYSIFKYLFLYVKEIKLCITLNATGSKKKYFNYL